MTQSISSSRRRWLLQAPGAVIGAGLAVCGGSADADTRSVPVFVLVHGAWHNASTYTEVIAQLAQLGHAAVALDLPGHGLRARSPSSWTQRPFNPAAFATERSPVAGVTLADYVAHTVEVIDQVRAQGHDQVVLVGHSAGGNTITAVGEAVAPKLSKLIYLSAFLPPNDRSALDALMMPEAAAGEVLPLAVADPQVVGAQRIDFLSPDPAYRAKIKSAFYGDVSDETFSAMAHLLSSDEPSLPSVTPIHRTFGNWGSLERHYIKCLRDRAVVPAWAQKMIDIADNEFPQHRTSVHTMDTSHSPFLSAPAALARLLSSIARA